MTNHTQQLRRQAGQTLVEVLVAIAVASIMLPALATAMVASREGRAQQIRRQQAAAVLRETTESVRVVREAGWTAFAVNGTYHPAISGSTWSLVSGADTISGFSRSVVVSDAQRNSSGAVVASGGTVDPSTKKVVSTISWTAPFSSSLSSTAYYQRYLGNASMSQTTQADYRAGVENSALATNTSGGELTLLPVYTWGTMTQTGTFNGSGNTDATKIEVDGNYAYESQGAVLNIYDISNPAAPTLAGSFTAGGTINGIAIGGNYVYLATTNTAGELTVVNATNKAAPAQAALVDLTNTTAGLSVYYSSNYVYVGRALSNTNGVNELYVVNVATPTAPVVSGSLNLTAAVNDIYVSGNYAYLATAVTTAELTIVNITTKSAPAQTGVYNSAGTTAAANCVFVVGTTVYLTEANNTGGAELFIVNASTPATPSLLGSYEAGAALNGVYISGNYAFLASAITNGQLRVLNISTPATPTVVGNFNAANTINGVYYYNGQAYLASASNTAELTIVSGVTTANYMTSGSFESSTMDAAAVRALNHFTFTITEPVGTNIQFQVATNSDNATWNYVGPDGTASTYYTSPGAIPLANITGRYVRYMAYLTGPGTTATPTLSDVSVNYSP